MASALDVAAEVCQQVSVPAAALFLSINLPIFLRPSMGPLPLAFLLPRRRPRTGPPLTQTPAPAGTELRGALPPQRSPPIVRLPAR